MKPFWITLPGTLLTSIVIAKLLLSCLQLPVLSVWLPAIALVLMLLLWQRSLFELALVAVIAAVTQLSFKPGGDALVSADILLALLISLVAIPAILSMMGIIAPSLGERQASTKKRA